MSAIIESIIKKSIAEEVGLEKGDEILKVNGGALRDLILYRFAINSEEVVLEVKKVSGELEIIEIEKDFTEDLGIIFETAVFDKIKPCTNKCIFCFVDQQPEGLRDSLYVKDDDYRLSYLQGTYITLTNLTAEDKKRISEAGLGPLYVSLHTTNPELRVKMLRNPKAANIMRELKWFQKHEIPLHLQIVLCPGYNDAQEFERTLSDLEAFVDIILSIAVVPVGLTKFRKEPLQAVDKACALATIDAIDRFNDRLDDYIACASDEFFLIAEEEIPDAPYYKNFAQLEDGVGVIRMITDDFQKRQKTLPKKLSSPHKIHILTSPAGKNLFEEINAEFNKIENLTSELVVVQSKFFGDEITVAGLVTGSDIIDQLRPIKEDLRLLVIPSVMLRPFSEQFLDNLTVSDVEMALECKIKIIQDTYSTKELVQLVQNFFVTCLNDSEKY